MAQTVPPEEIPSVLNICQTGLNSCSISSWDDLTVDDISVTYLMGGISAVAMYKVTPKETEDKNQNSSIRPSGLVVRLHREDPGVCDRAYSLAAARGAAPRVYYTHSNHKPVPKPCFSVSVYEFLHRGIPQENFLKFSQQDAVEFGKLVARLHEIVPNEVNENTKTVDDKKVEKKEAKQLQASSDVKTEKTQSQAPSKSSEDVKLAQTNRAILAGLGLSEDQITLIVQTFGEWPSLFYSILGQFKPHEDRADFYNACLASSRQALLDISEQKLLKGGCTSRVVYAHGDLHNQNMLRTDDNKLVAIDFESARYMTAVIDLSSSLLYDASRQTYAPLAHRRALLEAYAPSLSDQDQGYCNELWDLEVGQLLRTLFLTPVFAGMFGDGVGFAMIGMVDNYLRVLKAAKTNEASMMPLIEAGIIKYSNEH